jgi:hypothetical protein
MNALGGFLTVGFSLLVLTLPRRAALLALLAGVIYIPQQQIVEVFGINLTATRILLLVGLVRVVLRSEANHIAWNAIDRSLFLFLIFSTLPFMLRSTYGHVEVIGNAVDALLPYLIFRSLVQDSEDVRILLRRFTIALVPFLGLLAVESVTQANPFSLMGALLFDMRDGRVRCLGSFRNPSSLGTLGASFFTMYLALGMSPRERGHAVAGLIACLTIIYFAHSGGPLAALAFGVVAWLCWWFRDHMHSIRRLLLGLLIAAGLLMTAPIWYLPARLSLITGGGGWHRSYLMDVAFSNLELWWLAGMDLAQTRVWFPYILEKTGTADITNNFLVFGLRSGLLAIVLLVFLLVRAFQQVGESIDQASIRQNTEDARLAWSYGCVLVVHTVSWFGISYFDQMVVIWYLHLAIVSSQITANGIRERTVGDLVPRGA